jgi:transposase
VIGNGLPVQVDLSPGQMNDQPMALLLNDLPAGADVITDKGYDAHWIRDLIERGDSVMSLTLAQHQLASRAALWKEQGNTSLGSAGMCDRLAASSFLFTLFPRVHVHAFPSEKTSARLHCECAPASSPQ